MREWESFNAGDSDIGYFSDFDLSQAASRNLGHRCLISIKDMFDDLQECRQKLIDLQDSCQELTKDVSPGCLFYHVSTLTDLVETSLDFAEQ